MYKMYILHFILLLFQDNLKAIQARDRAFSKRAKKKEDTICAEILADGGNPLEQRLKEKRIQSLEKEER